MKYDIGLNLSMKKAKKKGKLASQIKTKKEMTGHKTNTNYEMTGHKAKTGSFPKMESIDTGGFPELGSVNAAAEMSGMKPRKKKRPENADSYSKSKGYFNSKKYKSKGYTGE